jgi:6,7-dimethyl-8-ribityllumazine synthase
MDAGASLSGRVGIAVSRFNEAVTRRLLDGAQRCLAERGVPGTRIDVAWCAGAWELPLLARAFAVKGSYAAVVALGAVVRGETPHFDYVAGEASRGLMDVQLNVGVPIGFGVLTCDTMEQALARAGGDSGNKGYDATAAALDAAAEMTRLGGGQT